METGEGEYASLSSSPPSPVPTSEEHDAASAVNLSSAALSGWGVWSWGVLWLLLARLLANLWVWSSGTEEQAEETTCNERVHDF